MSAVWATFWNVDGKGAEKSQTTIAYDDLSGHTLRLHYTDEQICAGNKGLGGYVDIGSSLPLRRFLGSIY